MGKEGRKEGKKEGRGENRGKKESHANTRTISIKHFRMGSQSSLLIICKQGIQRDKRKVEKIKKKKIKKEKKDYTQNSLIKTDSAAAKTLYRGCHFAQTTERDHVFQLHFQVLILAVFDVVLISLIGTAVCIAQIIEFCRLKRRAKKTLLR